MVIISRSISYDRKYSGGGGFIESGGLFSIYLKLPNHLAVPPNPGFQKPIKSYIVIRNTKPEWDFFKK